MSEVFICDSIRTPIGRYAGALSAVRADDLAAIPLKALMERNPAVDWQAVGDVILGCANSAWSMMTRGLILKVGRSRWDIPWG